MSDTGYSQEQVARAVLAPDDEALPVPQFWHVSWDVARRNDDGLYEYLGYMSSGMDEWDARTQARTYSRVHGSATVTNRAGLVATYVNGAEWLPVVAAQHTAEAATPVSDRPTVGISEARS